MNLKIKIIIVFIVSLFTTNLSFSQEDNEAKVSLKSPYHTIYTHLYFLQEDSYDAEKSAQTIQGNYTLEEKKNIAIKIKKVLDGKAIYVNMNTLPIDNNYIDSLSKKPIYFISQKEKGIYLEKKDSLWVYSSYTINTIDKMYNDIYPFWSSYLDKLIPNKTSSKSFLGINLGQYISLGLLIVLSFMLFLLIKKISLFIIKRLSKSIFKSKLPNVDLLIKIAKALALVLTFSFIGKAIPSIQLPLKLSIILIHANRLLSIFLTAFLLKNLFNFFLFYLEKLVAKTDTKLDNQLLPILSKIGKLIIYFTATIYILKELNINVTAILAGLSVGGLAVALASKDTVQNVIGSLNIFLDRPFEIGDYIVISGAEGSVEEVGLRATRIRTPNQSIAYIPNGNLSNMTIDNFGLRIYRRWKTSFGLDYNTKPEKIELFVQKTIEIINSNKNTFNKETMVYFNNLGASTLDIYVSVFFDVKSLREDMNSKQEILLEIVKMAKDNGIEFAFPTQTLYIAK